MASRRVHQPCLNWGGGALAGALTLTPTGTSKLRQKTVDLRNKILPRTQGELQWEGGIYVAISQNKLDCFWTGV